MSNFYPNLYNSCSFQGRMVKKPELLSGGNVAKFTLAVDKGLSKKMKEEAKQKGEQTADFIKCVVFGKTAQHISNFFDKGDSIVISAKFNNNNYEKNGEQIYDYQFVVTDFAFPLGNSNNGNGNSNNNKSKSNNTSNKNNNTSGEDFDDFKDLGEFDDDIPF